MANKQLSASIIIGGAVSGSLLGAIGKTKNAIAGVGEALRNAERRQRLLGQSIQTFGRQGRSVDGLRAEYARLGAQIERTRAAQERLTRASSRVAANQSARASIRGQIGGAIAGAAALAYPVGAMVSNATKFQREVQLIGNTANLSAGEVRALGRVILDVSAKTNQGADDVTRGIGFLVAAGLDVGQAQRSITSIGRTATATGADIEDMAKASFTLIDSLKIKPEGLQGALDILAVAGKEGNVELRDMARILPQLGSSFVALKMNGAEATATLGAALEVARKGAGSADEAANNMANFMAKVLAPTTLKKAQKNFGLDLYAIIQQAQRTGGNPFEASVEAIMKATQGDAKKLGMLFEDMQVQNFLRPMMQNWSEYQRIKDKALNESAGTTDTDFAKMMATEAEQMKAARQAADRFAKTLGTVLGPQIGAAAGSLARFLDSASAFVREHPQLVGAVVKGAVALAGMKVAVLGVRYAYLSLVSPVLKAREAFAAFQAAKAAGELGRVGMMAARVGPFLSGIGTAIAGIGVGPILAVGAALVGAAVAIRKFWEPIKAYFIGFGQGIAQTVGPALTRLGQALAPLAPAWDAVASAVGTAWRWFTSLFDPIEATSEATKRAGEAGLAWGTVVGGAIGVVIDAVGLLVKAFVWVGETIGTVAGWAVTQFDALSAKIGGVIDWIMTKLAPLQSAIGWVAGKAASIGGTVGSWFGDSPPAAGSAPAPAPSNVVPLPKPAARTGAAPVTDNRQYSFTIQQQPGENGEALAKRVAEQLKQQDGVRKRGALYDEAAA